MAHPGGRPLSYDTAEKLIEAISAYFKDNLRPTLAGLALGLNIDRQTLYNYANRDEYFDIIKKARETVEAKYEERLIWDNSPTGVIFALKNMGWKDKTEQEMYGKDGEPLQPPSITIYNQGPPLTTDLPNDNG